jgi:hypothetical protein
MGRGIYEPSRWLVPKINEQPTIHKRKEPKLSKKRLKRTSTS